MLLNQTKMKITQIKRFGAIAIMLVALAAFTTSCNRGVGCPNNFSIENAVDHCVPVTNINE